MNKDFEKAAGGLSGKQLTALAGELVAELEGRRAIAGPGATFEYPELRGDYGFGGEFGRDIRRIKETLETIVKIRAGEAGPSEAGLADIEAAENIWAPGREKDRAILRSTSKNSLKPDAAADAEISAAVYKSYSSAAYDQAWEAGRISDYFKIDSRRYDGGFTRY